MEPKKKNNASKGVKSSVCAGAKTDKTKVSCYFMPHTLAEVDHIYKLKADAAKLSETISRKEQKKNDVMNYVGIVKKYEVFTELTPEIMHELIDRIVVHAPEGGRANRTQQVDIHFRFNVVTATAKADFKQYYVRRKAV